MKPKIPDPLSHRHTPSPHQLDRLVLELRREVPPSHLTPPRSSSHLTPVLEISGEGQLHNVSLPPEFAARSISGQPQMPDDFTAPRN